MLFVADRRGTEALATCMPAPILGGAAEVVRPHPPIVGIGIRISDDRFTKASSSRQGRR
jgi:hypothetical protein